MKRYSVDNARNAAEKWVLRRPNGLRVAYADTRAEALELASDLNELLRLRVLLAWQCGHLAESQACALLLATPENLVHWRDTCLSRMVP